MDAATPPIYPILKPHDWPHRSLVAHRPLAAQVEGAPLIAFGFDAGANYQFVPAEECEDVERLYAESLARLALLENPWEVGKSGGLPFAAGSGREFSAEKLLDREAMRACHKLFDSEHLLAAAPRRTCLFASPADLNPHLLQMFDALTLHTYRDDSYGHAPISPAVYLVEDGEIIALRFPG